MGSCNKKATADDNAVYRVSRVTQNSIFSENPETLFARRVSQTSVLSENPESLFAVPGPKKSELFSQNLARRGSALLPQQLPGLINPSPSTLSRRGSSFNALVNLPRRASASNLVSKTEADTTLIKSALKKHFIFSNLTDLQIDSLIEEMQLCVYPGQAIVFEQNSNGENFFIIARGKVEVVINLKVVSVLSSGQSFGEVALLHDTPRTATIITLQETNLWALGRSSFREVLENIATSKYSENLSFIENIQIFNSLTKKQKEALTNAMCLENYKPGDKIIREGDSGDFMFVIKSGNVVITKNGCELRKMAQGDYFGEQSLLKDHVRTATVTALGHASCLSINSSGLMSVLGNGLQEIIHMNTQRMAIDADPVLGKLNLAQIDKVLSVTKIIMHKRGVNVRRVGEYLNGLIIVLKGNIGNRLKKFQSLDVLGLGGLQGNDTPLSENLTVIDDCTIAELTKLQFEEAIGGRINDVIERNQIFKVIKDIGIFRAVETKTLERLVRMLNLVYFKPKSYIFTEGSPGDAFFIVKSGNVEALKNGQLMRNISKFDYFGERSMIFNKVRSATVRALDNVECWTLTKSQFNSIFDENLKKNLLDRIELQDTPIELKDMCPVQLIHQGKISTFLLCANKANSKLYILKSVHKNTIIAQKLQSSLITHKKILSQLDHFFIVKLIKTFKDSFRLSMLLEYIPSVDLTTALKTFKHTSELDGRFYAAGILLIFEYLHEHEILYRDLNLKNLNLDKEGYIKLIDFSCAKYLQGKTFTLVGTPHYLAPEVINGQGYSYTADMWSLGVTIYLILYGNFPFGDDLNDPMQIYQQILNHRLVFPSRVDPLSKCRDFLSILLNKTASQRGSVEKIKNHPWFLGLDWDMMLSKQIKAPFIPAVKDYSQQVHDALKTQKRIEDVLPLFENSEKYIPRFNMNNRWDAEF